MRPVLQNLITYKARGTVKVQNGQYEKTSHLSEILFAIEEINVSPDSF